MAQPVNENLMVDLSGAEVAIREFDNIIFSKRILISRAFLRILLQAHEYFDSP